MSTQTAPACPTCGADVALPANVMAHELISCPDCGTELEVISLNPAVLDLAPTSEEDWGE
jgi:alpha-aminoadipate carrier protein LysW